MSLTTTRNLRQHMQQIEAHNLVPVLNVAHDKIENYRYLQLLALNKDSMEYDEMFSCAIHTSDGQSVKKVASKRTLFGFAKKYGFKPDNIVVNGMIF